MIIMNYYDVAHVFVPPSARAIALFSGNNVRIVNVASLSTFLAVQYLYRNDVGFCWIVYLILIFSYNSIPPRLV